MKPVGVPKSIQRLFPRRLWEAETDEKKIYLTFDDGPIPIVTPWVMDQLSEYNAKGTFFCIGENIERHPDLFKSLAAAGHTIGNHTFNHLKGWKTHKYDYLENVRLAEHSMTRYVPDVFESKKFFRPPYGKMTSSQAKLIENDGYTIVMWNLLSYDYDASLSGEQVFKNVQENLGKGSIVVLHDSLKAEKNLRYVLPLILREYSEEGYKFCGLNDLYSATYS